MKKISTLKKNLFSIIVVEAIIIAIYFLDFKIFINLQIASLSSFLIIIASNYTHKRMVNSKLKTGIYDNEDPLDKIEDPYDLYSEDEVKEDLDLSEVIKEERAKIVSLKESANNLAKSIGGLFSPIRLLSYLFLFVSFLYIVNNQKFYVLPYIIGLFIVPLSAMIGGMIKR